MSFQIVHAYMYNAYFCTKREETSFIYLHGFAEKADDENFGEFPSTN